MGVRHRRLQPGGRPVRVGWWGRDHALLHGCPRSAHPRQALVTTRGLSSTQLPQRHQLRFRRRASRQSDMNSGFEGAQKSVTGNLATPCQLRELTRVDRALSRLTVSCTARYARLPILHPQYQHRDNFVSNRCQYQTGSGILSAPSRVAPTLQRRRRSVRQGVANGLMTRPIFRRIRWRVDSRPARYAPAMEAVRPGPN